MNQHQSNTNQSSRVRREVRKPVAVTRSNRKPGSRWRAAAVAMSLGCAVSLSACGGGGGGASDPAKPPPPQSAPARATAAPSTVYILFEGDSTMYGSDAMSCQNPGCQNPLNEPVMTAQLLNDSHGFGPGAVEGINGAVPSTFLREMLPGGSPQYPYSFPTVLENVPAKIVVSNHAINDSIMEQPSEYERYLNNFIDDTLAAGRIPALSEPNPTCDGKHPNLDSFVLIMRSVAAQRNVLLIKQYDEFKSIPGWQSLIPDCVHPSTNGYAIKARNTAQALIPLIEKLRNG